MSLMSARVAYGRSVAFARRRAWVRIPWAPLLNFLQTTEKLKILVVTQRAPCSNPSKSPELLGMRQLRNTVVCSYFAISRTLRQSVALPCTAEGRGPAPLQETT